MTSPSHELPEATHLPEPGKTWSRYVAIGDSFTEEKAPQAPDRVSEGARVA